MSYNGSPSNGLVEHLCIHRDGHGYVLLRRGDSVDLSASVSVEMTQLSLGF